MAKKQASPEATEPAKAEAAPAAEGGAPKEAKKPRESKKKADAPTAEKPAADGAPATTDAPAAPAAPTAPGESTKKKGRPGVGPSRSKKLRKQMREQRLRIAKEGARPIKQAVEVLKKMKRSKFDETVEVHMALGIDATQSDQAVRGTISLPNGIGKSVRVVVFCQGDNIAKAKAAGADHAGAEDIIEKVQKESWTDFDVALATQDMMGKVSRLGKVLGPRGLMPTPKAGTVITGDVTQVVKEFKAGKVEYRSDKGGNVHAGVGKLSFDADKLVENIHTFVEQIRAAKPSGIKGNYIKSVYLSATMSPSVPLNV